MADTYKIEGVIPRVRSIGGGIFKQVQQVTFTTIPSGLTGTVDIDGDRFDVDTVRAAIEPLAAQLEAVKAL